MKTLIILCYYIEIKLKLISKAERPKFITGLVDEQVDHKGEVTLMVRADGLPKPEIKWYCNGKPINNDEHYSIETVAETQVTSKLRITNFEEENSGIVREIFC